MTDSDYFLIGITVIIVIIAGANLFLLISIRGYMDSVNRQLKAIAGRYGRLTDFLEKTEVLKRKTNA